VKYAVEPKRQSMTALAPYSPYPVAALVFASMNDLIG
jgi:hypothetical protein